MAVTLCSLRDSRTKRTGETTDAIQFDPIPVGESDSQSVWIHNELSDAELTVERVSVAGAHVSVIDAPDVVPPDGAGEIVVRASPIDTDTFTGLNAELTVDVTAIARP